MLLPHDVGHDALYHKRKARRQMKATRTLAALALAAALAGCGSGRLLSGIDVPESPEVAKAPWPRLVDTPAAPPVGSYTEAAPDPAIGAAILTELTAAANAQAARAQALAGPVLSEADKRRLGVAP